MCPEENDTAHHLKRDKSTSLSRLLALNSKNGGADAL